MNNFLVKILEEYLGEELEDLDALCYAVGDFIQDRYLGNFYSNDFTYEEIERELMWNIQEILEGEEGLIDALIGEEAAEEFFSDYNCIDDKYCHFDIYTGSVVLDAEKLCQWLEVEVADKISDLNQFVKKINDTTTLKMKIE